MVLELFIKDASYAILNTYITVICLVNKLSNC